MFTKEFLISRGFKETNYDGQEGLFYTKQIPTPDEFLPPYCYGDIPAKSTIEVLPDGGIQYILDFDLEAFGRFDQGEEGYEMLVSLAGLR